MVESRGLRWFLKGATVVTLSFIYLPLFVICLYAFNERRTTAWPIEGLSLQWFEKAVNNSGVRDALWTSVKAGLGATAIAVLLGTLAAIAVSRYRFFGRETIVPGHLPSPSRNRHGDGAEPTFRTGGIDLGLFTVIVGHATFCIVVVYNNAVARMRRISGSLDEASMDLGADAWQTFRYVTAPQISTAIIAGSLLAFALSFDEVIVTTFTISGQETLPIWILSNLSRPNQLPIVNVVAVFVILLSIIPVWIAQKLASGAGAGGRL
jgi:putative spermidine/putrescine transport system permease protein